MLHEWTGNDRSGCQKSYTRYRPDVASSASDKLSRQPALHVDNQWREGGRQRERERESDGKGGWDPGKAKRSKPVNLLIRTVERLIVWKLVDDPLADLHLFSVRGVWVLSCAPPSSVATCGPECHGTLASSPKTVRSENSCAEGSWFSFMSCTSDASKLAF